MGELYKQVRYIVSSTGYNDLPLEERERIVRFMDAQQILTMYQILTKHEDLTTERWRKEIRKWIVSCIKSFRGEYGKQE